MNILVSKEIRINVRTTEEIKREIEITARLRGLTVSSLINYLAVQAIREEKEREPQAFRDNKRDIVLNSAFIDIPDRGALTDERPINKKKVA